MTVIHDNEDILKSNHCVASLPDSKNPVYQESTQEAEDDVRPGVPGVQLHEAGSVQVQILVPSERNHIKTHAVCLSVI